MEIGIVGLPNVGKSTLFNALTAAGAGAENYPFCTIDPNIGVVNVPDRRFSLLCDMYQPEKKTPASIKFVDIAGLVAGASQGEGLGNQFLGQIRNVDAIAHVVRCFTDKNVSHVTGSIDPARDIEIIDTELIMADLESLHRKKEKFEKKMKGGDKKQRERLTIVKKIIDLLEQGKKVREMELSKEAEGLVKELSLLTARPVLYIANLGEEAINRESEELEAVKKIAAREKAEVVTVSAALEADLAELKEEEAKLFLEDMGLEEPGLNRIIRSGYNLLDLITFFTVAGGQEVRATTVERGVTAPEAAGKIHTDMQQGFIKAEVISFSELYRAGSMAEARECGLVRLEGKDYRVRDGDVCYFKFNS